MGALTLNSASWSRSRALEHLRLVECSGPLEISELGQHQMLFQNKNTLPVKVVLGGISLGYKCEVTSSRGGQTDTSTMPVSPTGELALIVLEGSQCSVKVLSSFAGGALIAKKQ